jgi:queuine tRNA-ribosyltransferase
MFTIESSDTSTLGRVGRLFTAHGQIETPVFMPVGTLGTVKCLDPEEIQACGFGLILGNAYHLYLRPGHQLIAELGGLHRFMQWPGAILTDSGGFQMVSLADLCEITDEGLSFKSHLDGTRHSLTPESCIEIQIALGSDIMMVLDHCPPFPCSEDQAKQAVQRTAQWARRCLSVSKPVHQSLFGIVQGGVFPQVRKEAAQELMDLGFDGYALGGLSLGEDKPTMFRMIDAVVSELPSERPRYLMGVGLPEDILEGVCRGVDMFDCVIPSRHGRTGWLFTSMGRVIIKQAQYARDESPIDPLCRCPVCQRFSRAYLRHLFQSNEMLGVRLNTLHNLWYYGTFMSEIREAIRHNRLDQFRTEYYRRTKNSESDTLRETVDV